jgi:hypothetical protein
MDRLRADLRGALQPRRSLTSEAGVQKRQIVGYRGQVTPVCLGDLSELIYDFGPNIHLYHLILLNAAAVGHALVPSLTRHCNISSSVFESFSGKQACSQAWVF